MENKEIQERVALVLELSKIWISRGSKELPGALKDQGASRHLQAGSAKNSFFTAQTRLQLASSVVKQSPAWKEAWEITENGMKQAEALYKATEQAMNDHWTNIIKKQHGN